MMTPELHLRLEEIRYELSEDGLQLEVERIGGGSHLLLTLTQSVASERLWERREMLARLRSLLPELDPPPRVKIEPHRSITLERTEDGRLLLRQLKGKYRTVEVLAGRGEYEFFLWVTDERRWFHLLPLPGEEVRQTTMERVFVGVLRRHVEEEWVRRVLE